MFNVPLKLQVAVVKALAAPFYFGAMESESIQEQLIANAHLSVVKDKLLLEADLTLDKALTIACNVEEAVQNTTLLSSANMVLAAVMQAITTINFQGKRGAQAAQTEPGPQGHCKQTIMPLFQMWI